MVEEMESKPEEHQSAESQPTSEAAAGPDVDLLVRSSDEHVARFDPQRIIDALVREARLDVDVAAKISLEIKQLIARSGIRALSSSLIRELVSAKLVEYGLESAYRAHTRLGVPLYDAERIICQGARHATLHPHGPEGTSLTLAEAIKREYAILSVFSEKVANAHLTGDIHIQGIGTIDRPHNLVSSIDYLKQHGITLPHHFASSKPARYPDVLIAHLTKFTAALQGYVVGPIAWDSLNFALAPFLEGMDERALQQLAQSLIFELSAPAIARGGQFVACQLHLDWDAPDYLATRPALGPGGQETGKTYGEYTETARRFLQAMFEVFLHGDAAGRPFLSPRPILHITDRFATTPGFRAFLELVSQVAVEKGGLRIALDREESRSFLARFGIPFDAGYADVATWRWRSSALQSVALNLPRIGFQAEGELVRVLQGITEVMEVAAQAHLEKRVFLERLMAMGENGPLSLLVMRRSEAQFLRLAWTTFLMCPVGMDELVFHLTGEHLHESDHAVETALKLLDHLRREIRRLSSKHKVRFVLAESHDEVTPHRLARQDLRSSFSEQAARCVSGDPSTTEAYYTSGLKVLPRAPVSALERTRVEGLLHDYGVFDALTPIWLNKEAHAVDRMAVFISQAFYQTHGAALLPAPEFTLCLSCGRPSRGFHSACPHCQSQRLDGLALSTDHFSRTSTWGQGLLAQLRDRYRVNQELE